MRLYRPVRNRRVGVGLTLEPSIIESGRPRSLQGPLPVFDFFRARVDAFIATIKEEVMPTVQAAPPVTPIEQRGYAHPEVLVSADWVAAHLTDPKVRLVESNEDILLYDTGHVPGAVKIDWTTDLNDQLVRDYVDRERLQKLLRSKGINDDTTIVF
jgi:hypothetical protein